MPLTTQFKNAARDALLELFPKYAAIAPSDYRRVYRPTGPGTHSITIEPYRGSSTAVAFLRDSESSSTLSALTRSIQNYQPEFTKKLVLPGRAMRLGDSTSMLFAWFIELERTSGAKHSLEDRVDSLLGQLEALLESKTVVHCSKTSLAGVKFSDIDAPIPIDEETVLRQLSDEEIIELGAQDITFGQAHDLVSHAVSCCIDYRKPCSFGLEEPHAATNLAFDVLQESNDRTADILRALHVLKSGRAGVFLTQTDFTPRLLPYMSGGTSWPLNRPAFASLELGQAEVATFLKLERALRMASRQELRIAADRLVDAEGRLSPVDALLDAVIGLEVLLNPMDSSELAFRVALNYAFLAEPEHRRERYERVRLLQKTRNRVVHGGLGLKSDGAEIIQEHATLAKACLRDVLQSFLLDDSLGGNEKLDSEYWLDRVLPIFVKGADGTHPEIGK